MTTVDEYLASLPADRRDAISKIRDTVNANLPTGYEEGIQYGMISWFVPESVLPAKSVYNGQPLSVVGLGSQKNHMALYMMCVYGDQRLRTWFELAYKKSGKKLDMGKACVRFKSLDALPLDVIGEAVSKVSVDNYVAAYRQIRAGMGTHKANAEARTASAPRTKVAATAASRTKTAVRTNTRKSATKKSTKRAKEN